MMASVTDVAGINSISAQILANAAAAMAGMVQAPPVEVQDEQRPLVAATMFGVTTPCVTHAREALEARGYEVLTFHATGIGGRAMEALVESGFVGGVLDATTTELCDELVGGVLSAGPDRLEAAGAKGIPQVVSLGALDMVNFGARDTVPPQFEDRNLYVHNPTITLMRTTPEECAELGRRIARKLSAATGPVALFVPLGGVSMIDAEGQPFHDPDADAALFEALRADLADNVELVEMDCNINDEAFADGDGREARRLPGGGAMTGDEARAKLRATLDAGGVIIGAGAGTGLSAKCAEAGGTDLIIIYNSGRYRMAGRGSLAGPDALRRRQRDRHGDGRRGAAGRRRHAGAGGRLRDRPVPADAAVPAPGPRRRLRGRAELPHRRPDRRHLPRQPRGDRDGLRARGRDDPRGRLARPADQPRTCSTRSRPTAMAEAGADVLVPHMGLTTKGTIGAQTALTLDDCVGLIQAMRDAAVAVNPDVIVLCHGGPLAEPDDAQYVLDRTEGVVGFFGASSMERLPTEVAMTENMRRFKALSHA